MRRAYIAVRRGFPFLRSNFLTSKFRLRRAPQDFVEFFDCQLKSEILIESLNVVFYLLIKGFGFIAIDFRQLKIQHHLLAANRVDFIFYPFTVMNCNFVFHSPNNSFKLSAILASRVAASLLKPASSVLRPSILALNSSSVMPSSSITTPT